MASSQKHMTTGSKRAPLPPSIRMISKNTSSKRSLAQPTLMTTAQGSHSELKILSDFNWYVGFQKLKFVHSHLYNLFQGYSTCIYSIKLNYVIFVQPYAPCTNLRTHPACFMLAWIIRRLVRWGTYSTAADLWVWEEIPKLTWGLTWVSTSTISCAWR